MKLISALIFAPVVLVILFMANEVHGTVEIVGEPYQSTFSYCDAYTGIGGTRHCSKWMTGTETRVKTLVHGLFFDTESYKIVR